LSANTLEAAAGEGRSSLAHQFDDAEQQHESATLGMWAFLATEVLFFGVLMLAYAIFRSKFPEAFAAGSGVCQDLAHVFIAAARHIGVPARYVAGYRARDDGQADVEAPHGWVEALGTLAGFDEQVPQATTSTELETGLAISPMDAARCVLDFQRTACFLRGTLAAIEAAINRKAGKVEVLYAGCGPLAPLAVALCHRVENVRFWPVDIHQISVDSVVRLVRNAGYEKRFGEIVVADAAQYQWPQRGEVGIIEVMLRGLENEPQVAVTDNLVRQLVSDGEIVPSAVRLDIQLYDPTTEFDLEIGRAHV